MALKLFFALHIQVVIKLRIFALVLKIDKKKLGNRKRESKLLLLATSLSYTFSFKLSKLKSLEGVRYEMRKFSSSSGRVASTALNQK